VCKEYSNIVIDSGHNETMIYISNLYSKTPLKKKFLKALIVIAFFCLGYFLAIFIRNEQFYQLVASQSEINTNVVVVTLTEQGYLPEVIIKKGTTVVFKSELDKPFWPASNLHPSHELYGDFDSKRPLNPNESWSFVFNRVGVWQMHDHIRSYYTGTITVID